MTAISEFHNCVVKEVSEETAPKKESMGMKIKRASLEEEEKKEEERAGEEKSSEEENDRKQTAVDDEQSKSLDEELEELKKNLLKDKIKRNKELRKLDEERKKAELKTKKLADEQKCLERALEVKTVEEERTAEILIKMVIRKIDMTRLFIFYSIFFENKIDLIFNLFYPKLITFLGRRRP